MGGQGVENLVVTIATSIARVIVVASVVATESLWREKEGKYDPLSCAFILLRHLLPPPRLLRRHHRPFQFAAWPCSRTCPTFRDALASSDLRRRDYRDHGRLHHVPTRDAIPRRRANRDARDERSTTTPPHQRLRPTKCAFPTLANSVYIYVYIQYILHDLLIVEATTATMTTNCSIDTSMKSNASNPSKRLTITPTTQPRCSRTKSEYDCHTFNASRVVRAKVKWKKQ
jgi:hypothetical protein